MNVLRKKSNNGLIDLNQGSSIVAFLKCVFHHVNRLKETKLNIQTSCPINVSDICVDFIRLIDAAHLVLMLKNSSLATGSKVNI